ncbi:GNAT family N-acetyltransferase [Murdochiella vaginalis]|uniref:GNAT family N-acetyltransferase n=1 Tax=Murdochiella vaginalis TaxID=1852373 RepID=UPI0008FE1834|nr:GNAT family protein [Murdochiella vaginalis]
MHHKGTQIIETPRLILRPFTMDDAEAMFRNWHADEEVTKFLTWQAVKSVEETKAVLQSWVTSYADPSFYQWAIELKELQEGIGSLSVVGKEERTDTVHIGYAIGKKWWHKGITTEAFQAIIPFLFQEVGANRIESQHDPNNPHSGQVMKKCGLTYEGTLRQADRSNQGIVDAAIYSLLREEWEKRGK